jgi:hypothetical protein
MGKTSMRAHRFSVLCAVAAVVSLGSSPVQAFAADEPIGAVGSAVGTVTDPVTDVVTTATDPIDTGTTTDTVDAVSNAASGTVDTVSGTTSGTVDPVSGTASGTVDTVSGTTSSTVDPVSGTASGAVDTVSGTTSGTVDPVSGTASGTVGTGSAPVSGGETPAIQGAAGSIGSVTRVPLTQAREAAATDITSASRSSSGQEAAAIGDEGQAACVAAATACQTVDGNAAGSWTRSVADIIRKLLALTGGDLFPWIVAAGVLTLAGVILLYKAKNHSEFTSA